MYDLGGKVFYTDNRGEDINLILDFMQLNEQSQYGYSTFNGMDFKSNHKGVIYASGLCEGTLITYDWSTLSMDTLFQGPGEVIPAMNPNESYYVLNFPHPNCPVSDSIAPYLTYTYNEGITWSVPVEIPMEGRPRSLQFVDEQTGFLAEGNYITTYFGRDDEFGKIRKTKDGGQTWTTEFESDVGIRKLQMFAEDFGYAIRRLGKVYKLDGYLPPINTTPVLPPVEIPDFGNDPVYVYPNPAYGVLTVQFQDKSSKRLLLINEFGKTLIDLKTSERMVELNIESIRDGLYTLQVIGIPGRRIAKRIMILKP